MKKNVLVLTLAMLAGCVGQSAYAMKFKDDGSNARDVEAFKAAAENLRPLEINDMIRRGKLSEKRVQAYFRWYAHHLNEQSSQNGLIAILHSNAKKWVDVNLEVEYLKKGHKDLGQASWERMTVLEAAKSLGLSHVVKALKAAGARG